MNVQAELISGISKKNGNAYIAIRVTLPNGFQKLIFPKDTAEKFVFEQAMQME